MFKNIYVIRNPSFPWHQLFQSGFKFSPCPLEPVNNSETNSLIVGILLMTDFTEKRSLYLKNMCHVLQAVFNWFCIQFCDMYVSVCDGILLIKYFRNVRHG